ncbi:hypothetical protein AV656_08365 [Bhargavaea cecembensis]|uniref:Uncharacterized protein n=1 Tax=Bhargavaea cecembensis TaxID=394098 RepID=A0A165H6A5_9BACL|nr:hypothetical protein [Bhargavaea cecembensis]KZE38904.1 hypothetical protein AV656_08365 [Bhargavaea cecembensis]
MGQNLLEITEAQFYFLAVEWMETYRSKPDDREGTIRERMQSMTTSDLINLYASAGPELVKTAVREELSQRKIQLSK